VAIITSHIKGKRFEPALQDADETDIRVRVRHCGIGMIDVNFSAMVTESLTVLLVNTT